MEEETEEHIWFGCEFTKQVASQVFAWLGIGYSAETVADWLRWFNKSYRKGNVVFQTKLIGFIALIYFV